MSLSGVFGVLSAGEGDILAGGEEISWKPQKDMEEGKKEDRWEDVRERAS